jgi:hypothetical protein
VEEQPKPNVPEPSVPDYIPAHIHDEHHEEAHHTVRRRLHLPAPSADRTWPLRLLVVITVLAAAAFFVLGCLQLWSIGQLAMAIGLATVGVVALAWAIYGLTTRP